MSESLQEGGKEINSQNLNITGGNAVSPVGAKNSLKKTEEEGFPGLYLSSEFSLDSGLPGVKSGPYRTNMPPDQDPYMDDDILQDEFPSSYQRSVGMPSTTEHAHQSYERGSYSNFSRLPKDSIPFVESGGYRNYSNRSSVDYSSSYPESHSVPRGMNSASMGYGNPVNDGMEDDGLFIESMPGIANENYVKHMYRKSNVMEPLHESMDGAVYSPRTRSPRPYDAVPHRHPSAYRDEDYSTPDLTHGVGSQAYGSFSNYREGPPGLNPSYHPSNMSENDEWNRTRSLSRNMDALGGPYNYPHYSRNSYTNLAHSPQAMNDMGYAYNDYEMMGYHDMPYPQRVQPHRVASMEVMAPEYGNNRGFLSRSLPHNRSFMDSLGMLERDSDMPLSRAKSMMYLGEDADYDNYGMTHTAHVESVFPPHSKSIQDMSILTQATSLMNKSQATNQNPTVTSESKTDPQPPQEPAKTAEIQPIPSSSPIPAGEEKKAGNERREVSPAVRGERNSRSKSPREDRDDDEKHGHGGKFRFPCRDFEKGVCSRGAACKFYHDPAKAVTTPDKIPVCRDFSKGKCTRDNCRFRHPGTHKDNVLMGIEEPSAPDELENIMKQYSSTLKPRNF